jgi:Ni/Co efflux regulator RcnB
MKRFLTAASALVILTASAGAAFADPRHDNRGNDHRYDSRANGHDSKRHHSEWRKGTRLARNDWNRGQRVDWRSHRLSSPPRGYEWRQVDGDYVLAAAATGIIASIIMANH